MFIVINSFNLIFGVCITLLNKLIFMVFLDFGQILMDNHKLVTISVLVFLKHDKNAPLFLENKHEKPLEFSRIHENKTYFCIF
jgi:hypothetical protein